MNLTWYEWLVFTYIVIAVWTFYFMLIDKRIRTMIANDIKREIEESGGLLPEKTARNIQITLALISMVLASITWPLGFIEDIKAKFKK